MLLGILRTLCRQMIELRMSGHWPSPVKSGSKSVATGGTMRPTVPASQRATKHRQSEPNTQSDEHSVQRAKLRLERLDDLPPTPDSRQVTSSLQPCERIEVGFQQLASLGF